MKVSPKEMEQRLLVFKEGLKQARVKLTPQRMEVFREVAMSEDHPDAEKIFKGLRHRLPAISLDTVYRTLWLLLDLGLIDTLSRSRHYVRFDGNISLHHHFICARCGLVRDFKSAKLDDLELPDSVSSIGHAEKTQVEVKGLCLKCAAEKKSGAKKNKERRKDHG